MRKLVIATCVLAAFGGAAIAQTSTTPAKPPSSPQATGSDANKAGLRRVEGTAMTMTFYTANPADTRAAKLIGSDVYNLNNEDIGEVKDLVIDDGKTIKAVVIEVGGFLGMGERTVAISPGSVVMSEQSDGSYKLVVNTTKEDLKGAKPFTFADVDKAGPNAGKAFDAKKK